MGDPRPLTTEEAREHARRWAAWQGNRDGVPMSVPHLSVGADSETERLFAWVRAHVGPRRYLDTDPEARKKVVDDLAGDLGIDAASAYALVTSAAGWPS